MGTSLDAAFVNMPYFDSPTVRVVQDALLVPVAMFGFGFLLHFTLVFPTPQRLMASRFALPAIYTPLSLPAPGGIQGLPSRLVGQSPASRKDFFPPAP